MSGAPSNTAPSEAASRESTSGPGALAGSPGHKAHASAQRARVRAGAGHSAPVVDAADAAPAHPPAVVCRNPTPIALRTKLTRAAIALAIACAGGGLTTLLWVTRPRIPHRQSGPPVARVLAFAATEVAVRRPWEGWGTIRALDAADVPARVATTVRHVPPQVRAGASVNAGDLLVELDDADFVRQATIARQRMAEVQAQLEQLEVEGRRLAERLEVDRENLQIAQSERERTEELGRRSAASSADLDSARRAELAVRAQWLTAAQAVDQLGPRRLQLEAMQAAQAALLAAADEDTRRCRVTSPLGGWLERVDVDEGESVVGGARIARVLSLAEMELALHVPASARGAVQAGDPVQIESTGGQPRRWEATVARVSPVDDPETRTMTLYAEWRQQGPSTDAITLVPGMFMRGVARSARTEPRYVVPRRSVRSGRVWVVVEGTLRPVAVRIAYLMQGPPPAPSLPPDDQWAVLEGPLAASAMVALEGAGPWLDGQSAQVLPLQGGGSAAADPAGAGGGGGP